MESKPTNSPTFVCGPKIYEYNGWIFEVPSHSVPWPMRKDLELRARAGKVFYDMYYKDFDKLSTEKKEQYRIGGGCIKL